MIDWIEHILKRKNWTGTDLARKSELAPSTILRLMNDPHHNFVPSLKTLRKIAEGSGYAIPSEIVSAFASPGIVSDDPFSQTPRSFVARPEPPMRFAGGDDGPRQESLMKVTYISGLPASLQAKDAPDRAVPVLPQLAGDTTATAYFAPDSVFAPIVPAGALLYCTRSRDPKPDDLVVIVKKDGRSLVRNVVDLDSDGVSVSKTVPASTEAVIGYDDIATIATVVAIVR
ncbi:MAG: helix-turn-helix transcriptional regulator [Methylobacteriaceae bacterium]|nr:helix-turn-helix transcriptional regulator [Methylobacteriaceae bacterium]